jgi:hypothetical protein
MRRVFHPETNGVKASPHRHKRVLSHGAPADPSGPWNIHAAPVSPHRQTTGADEKADGRARSNLRRQRAHVSVKSVDGWHAIPPSTFPSSGRIFRRAVRPLEDFPTEGPTPANGARASRKEKGRGGGLSLSWMVLTRSTPKGEVYGGANTLGGHIVSTDPRSTVPLLGFNRVSSEEEMVSSGD